MQEGLLLQSAHRFDIRTNPGETGTATFARLAAGLNTFDPSFNEEVDQTQYLDGDGYGTSTVLGAQVTISFGGHRKYGDPAQDYIYGLVLEIGNKRETEFRWTQPDGTIFEGPCTIANITGPSGDANAKGEIGFEIHFNGKPTETTATPET